MKRISILRLANAYQSCRLTGQVPLDRREGCPRAAGWLADPNGGQAPMTAEQRSGLPPAPGLYDPSTERDACGVGFVVDIKGRRSHAIVSQALTVLKNLLHRGACGCEPNTGDGAGILIQMPHAFLAREAERLGIALPAPGHYGSGLVFLPRDRAQADE